LLSFPVLPLFGCSAGDGYGGASASERQAATSAAALSANGPASADPLNLVYRDDFAVDAMVYDPPSGKLAQHFAGHLYAPTLVGRNQLVSTGALIDSTEILADVDGTWYVDPAQVAVTFDPTNPPPHTVFQMRPDPALSHVRFAFKDGSVLELRPDSHPALSANFALGNSTNADGSTNYNFFFTETFVLLSETAGAGRFAGMVGDYTFHQAVTIVGPNLQVHSRGIAMITLKNGS
jgi:hypothetical protein